MLFALHSPSPVLFHFICWTAVCNFACCRVVQPLCLCSLAMGDNSKLSAQQWCARGIWTVWAVLIYDLSLEWTVIAATTHRKLNSLNGKKQTVSHEWQSFEGCFDSHHWCSTQAESSLDLVTVMDSTSKLKTASSGPTLSSHPRTDCGDCFSPKHIVDTHCKPLSLNTYTDTTCAYLFIHVA